VPEVQEPVILSGKSIKWKFEFKDICEQLGDWTQITRYYYKSECRPLLQLKAWHRYSSQARSGHSSSGHPHSFREWLDFRDKARKDLYWLGKVCIGTEQSGAGFREHVHREMCEMFVPKNFDGVYHKNYTLDDVRKGIDKQNRQKSMLLLAPRGSFKSTVNVVDAAQWMLNAPDIRIFIVTGSGPLADKFLKAVKGFFYRPEKTGWTYFQSLFPEYVLRGKDGVSAADLVCPARICRQEGNPTLWVNSIGGVMAGWHCDVFKGDDIVDEDNSNTEDTREKLKRRYDNVSANLPDEWAFKDLIGTRYYPDDYYGERLSEMKKWGDTNSMKVLKRAAWTVKPGYEGVPLKQLQSHMVDLYFPEKLTFYSLIEKCRANEEQFRCQQLNEPAAGDIAVQFDEDVLRAHVIVQPKVPYPTSGNFRKVAVAWDTAHGDTMQSDYSAGAAGYCHEEDRSLYVLEVRSGKWKDSEVAVQVVDMHLKWNAVYSEIEQFPGWELLAAEIQRVAYRKTGKTITLIWRPVDNSVGSKRNAIKSLETVLADNRLWFVEGEWIDLTFMQFTRFTGFSKRRKDDIPDAISRLQRLIPRASLENFESVESAAERKRREAQEMQDNFARQQHDAAYRTVFERREAPPPSAAPPAEDDGPARIFGRNGLHL
jgi:phage terminase large subunit-like protein